MKHAEAFELFDRDQCIMSVDCDCLNDICVHITVGSFKLPSNNGSYMHIICFE